MRRLIARLVIIATLTLVGAGFTAAPASAANCATYQSPTYYQGAGNWLNFYGAEHTCTDVDLVELAYTAGSGQYSTTGWNDISWAAFYPASNTATPVDIICGRYGVTFTDSCGTTWYVHPWCNNAAHYIKTDFEFRLHNKSQQSWGPWHYALSPQQYINC